MYQTENIKNVAIAFYKESSKKDAKLLIVLQRCRIMISTSHPICLGRLSILYQKSDRTRELGSLEQANLSLNY